MKRTCVGMAVILALVMTANSAYAQGPGAGHSGMGPSGQDIMSRILCDVEGLWFTATFEAKLDAAALDKLKPVCQKAAESRAKESAVADMGDRAKRAMTIKGVGDEMAKAAKEALGADSAKLEGWFQKRDDAMKALEERLKNAGGAARGPQPAPAPSTPNAAQAPVSAPVAPVAPQAISK
ncbi:MAG: hypothetical protein HZB26_15380 [Candidatus Hydrogenedentes bacterium]|nr:hypothetical protein [Candidatus Hydrogenedentota bacterium]